jgi:diacylglycerol kinase family enzyme
MTGAPGVASPTPGRPETGRARRWHARLALLAALGAVLLPLLAAGLRGSIAMMLTGLAVAAAVAAGIWLVIAHRGLIRWLGAAMAAGAPLAAAVAYARHSLLWAVVASGTLALAAAAESRRALASAAPHGPAEEQAPPPHRPFLIMNTRSGGGKVRQFGLVSAAEALGADVAVLDESHTADVIELARRAVTAGADLLGVAGGDGTQALVAGVAAEYGIPFLVIPAGTRNHFALDLGLDVGDLRGSLDALTDGVEVRVDLGVAGDRFFVNNASFGAYAAIVQSPAYRDEKTRTALELLPDLLTDSAAPPLQVRANGMSVKGAQAVLVSNNPYAAGDIAGFGRRPRLDTGMLGVLAIRVHGAVEAVRVLRGLHSGLVTAASAWTVLVNSEAPAVPVAVDGEAISLPTPVICSIRPGALRVRVPRNRPGVRPQRQRAGWAALRRLAGGAEP